MNFKSVESEQKLSGSYYTPSWIASFICRWIAKYNIKTILEPSCGDGVFFESLETENANRKMSVYGFDINPVALENSKTRIKSSLISTDLKCGDFLSWAIENIKANNRMSFDAVIGNPPFIRYQYLEKEQQELAQELFALLGLKFTKHTNAWIPFVLASVEFLNPGGVIGMVIPSEIMSVLYTQGLRNYLLEKCNRILLIDPEDIWFDNTLQGAMLLLAEKKSALHDRSSVAFLRTQGSSFSKCDPKELFDKSQYISGELLKTKWTYGLLTREEADAYKRVCSSTRLFRFRELADVDVGIVTGANQFFLVPDKTVERYGLNEVAHPMFGRSGHCPGVIYDELQHIQNAEKGHPTNFLYFENESDGIRYEEYLEVGISQEIPLRYKCRTRNPWYKVPSVYTSPICMLKRSNGIPRLILNQIKAYTTDTAYRVTPKNGVDPSALVFCFFNTVTSLSAELEGRSYGGGVLELVPSEIENLTVPYLESNSFDLNALNQSVKSKPTHELLKEQDRVLLSQIRDIDFKDIVVLQEALNRLQMRRKRISDTVYDV